MWAPPYFTILQPSSTLFDYHCAHRTDTNERESEEPNHTLSPFSQQLWTLSLRFSRTTLCKVFWGCSPYTLTLRCDVVLPPNDRTDTPCFFSKLDNLPFLCIFHAPILCCAAEKQAVVFSQLHSLWTTKRLYIVFKAAAEMVYSADAR
ncbi:hypothetical protein GmHk_13G039371 [Glycine max]|nr:hypothetical protein GmHk_13G039371 [Glycine max]